MGASLGAGWGPPRPKVLPLLVLGAAEVNSVTVVQLLPAGGAQGVAVRGPAATARCWGGQVIGTATAGSGSSWQQGGINDGVVVNTASGSDVLQLSKL